ncbi:MAG TPA: GAF domain-containing protein [Burkholderiales bacterium]
MKPVARTQPAARSYRGRLFRKYFLLILAPVCGALIISGGIGLYFSYQENKEALADLQSEKAAGAAARIEQFVREIEQQVAAAALPQLGTEGLEQRRLEFLKLLRMVDRVTDISLIDAKGREQLSVSRLKPDTIGSNDDRSQEPAFRNARAGQTWFGPVYFRKETEPYMSIAVRGGGEAGPVTVAEVNLKFMWDVITRIRVGRKGKAYVVDGAGYLIADPDIGLVLRKTDLSALEQVKAALAPGAEDSAALVAKDPAGQSVLTAFAPIEPARERAAQGRAPSPLGWKVFVEQPVSEVYAALDAIIYRTVALILAGLVFSALAAMWLARSMARPIGVLQEGAQRIGAGDLEQKIEVRTGDELEALAGQFNRMTEQLRESYAGLERKVEERTGELQQSLEQQTATSEILKVISSSTTDVQPVFEAIVESGLNLFPDAAVAVVLPDGAQARLAAIANLDPQRREDWRRRWPVPLTREYLHGVAILDRKLVDVPDGAAHPEDDLAPGVRNFLATGYRAITIMPMIRGDTAIGTVTVVRLNPGPLSEKQLATLRTFADQAVIAIENVRLFNETKEGLEQQTAISEVLRVISSSPGDVRPVLQAVAERSARICDAKFCDIIVVQDGGLGVAAATGDLGRPQSGETVPLTRTTAMGRSILERIVVHVPDIDAAGDEFPLGRELALRFGHRTTLAVPLVRENKALGTILLRRTEVRPFEDKHIALLRTFADQAAIAIENVRLFNETREALERQTATAEVLRVISGSITDARPVFDAISRSVLKLYGARSVSLVVRVGERIDRVAYALSDKSADDASQALYPIPLDEGSLSGRAILRDELVHIRDVDTEPGLAEHSRAITRRQGVRSVLIAPMHSMGATTGALAVGRRAPGGFSEREVELIRTFADQAVIAMENVRLFREIEEKSAQLEVANKHKSEFLANMSHELRTPLNAIIGFSEVLSERMFGEVNEKQADYLKDIHESGKHLLSLINDILDLSKIEAGRMDLELSRFHLPSALSNAVTLVRERAQRHGIELSVEVDQRLGAFQADERKFKQIMLNLLSNAVKFTPDGGRVAVSAKQDTTCVEIAVRDTGIGIAPEDQAAVFEEFKQVGRDYTKKAEGTGLGLALAKRFVELHGGSIRLESTPGKGSTFTVSLPIRQ